MAGNHNYMQGQHWTIRQPLISSAFPMVQQIYYDMETQMAVLFREGNLSYFSTVCPEGYRKECGL